MGCIASETLAPIPPPEGHPQDPLQSEGDIIEVILTDPHIHYYQKKIEEVLIPLRKNRGGNSQFHKFQHKKAGMIKTGVESFATTDKRQHEQYVKAVNQSLSENDDSTTNILSYMIQEMADIREGKKASQFQNDSYAALKCFIFLYTGNYTYKKINQQLRRNEYQKITNVIAVVKTQLERYNKEKFARQLKANAKDGNFLDLYRGIDKPDKKMIKGNKMYWKGFTSTSLDSKVAANFGKYTYVIRLKKKQPHSYMIVPEDLSKFKEQQIILFPYFHFECIGVEDYTSSARYMCSQINFDS